MFLKDYIIVFHVAYEGDKVSYLESLFVSAYTLKKARKQALKLFYDNLAKLNKRLILLRFKSVSIYNDKPLLRQRFVFWFSGLLKCKLRKRDNKTVKDVDSK